MVETIPDSRSGLATNVVWVGVGNGIALVAGLVSSVLLARWLGPESRGAYALVVTSSLVLASIFGQNAWIQAMAFLAGKRLYMPSRITGLGILIALMGTIILVIPLAFLPQVALVSLFPGLSRGHLVLVAFLTGTTLLFGTLTGVLTGLNKIPLWTAVSTVKVVIALILQIILLGIFRRGFGGALWELALSATVVSCLTLIILVRVSGIDFKIGKGLVTDVSVYAGKAYPGHLGVVLMSRMDIYFVVLFAGLEAAGYYAVAKGLVEISTIIEQSISQGVMPDVISRELSAAGLVVARAYRTSFWASALVLGVGAVLANWLIPWVYGIEFEGVVPAFLLLVPGTIFLATRTLGTFFSMQIGRPEIPSYVVMASGLLSLPITYFLTRQFGYLGAAAAFSLISIFRGALSIALFVRFSRVKLRDVLLLNTADLVWLPQLMLAWLRGRHSTVQETQL